jgi:hypothetical protein
MSQVPIMRKLCLLAALLVCGVDAQARLGIPLVDLVGSAAGVTGHLTGAAAGIAIWSYTNVTMDAGDTLVVHFPKNWQTPTALSVSTCNCIFAKYMYNTNAFTAAELTVTSGTFKGLDLSMQLPVTFTPGPFYVRLDDSASYKNPLLPGLTTLTLSYTHNNITVTTQSKAISIGDGLTSMGEIDGYVYSNYTAASGSVLFPVQGALVIADNTDMTNDTVVKALPAWDMGPAAVNGVLPVSPLASTEDRYTTVTGSDGRFKLQVPYYISTDYHLVALYSTTGTAGANSAKNRISQPIGTVTVNTPTAWPLSVTLTGFIDTTPNN